MPPVRWKICVISVCVLLCLEYAASSKLDSVSMSEDGWRPIMGGGFRDPSYDDEITQYRNPSKLSEAVKIEKPYKTIKPAYKEPQPPTAKPTSPNNLPNNQATFNLGEKYPVHSKPLLMLPGHPGLSSPPGHPGLSSPPGHPGLSSPPGHHGPQIPLGPMMHRPPMKYGHILKMHPHKRLKPIRMQMPSFSTRDEVFVPAPSSNINPYSFYSGGIKTRINQPHAHIEFNNHFPMQPNPQDELYQIVRAPVQQYVVPKQHQIPNEIHYYQNPDDFNRNLVPPPFKFVQEEKPKLQKPPYRTKEVEPVLQKPSNEIVPSFNKQFTQNENPVDVQVTKEKFQVFHNAVPNNYNPIEDFPEYHAVKTPSPQKLVTYEVTEGKWQETPPYQYQYSTRNPNKSRRPPPPPPQQYNIIENKPFLPTPLKPDIAPPTAPTESEVSTIYNQIAKLNRQKEQATINPTYFDIKEVSTHFPIIGQPDYQEYPTRFSVDPKDSFEINEITTKNVERPTFMYENEETTTMKPITTRPQRKRLNQRRRRPSTTTSTSTTTEEVEMVTDVYEAQKTEEETQTTERPVRARRPSRFRTTTTTEEAATVRSRQRRPRPTTTEETVAVPDNHKTNYAEPTFESYTQNEDYIIRPTTEKEFPASFESHFASNLQKTSHESEDYEEPAKKIERRPFENRYYTNPPTREKSDFKNNDDDEYSIEDEHYGKPEATKDPVLGLSLNTPDNEIDYTTKPYSFSTFPFSIHEEIVTSPEPTTTTSTTTTTQATTTPTTTKATTTLPPTTTTTTEASTTRSHRVRGRPVKYDNSNRPRFSVKEYRQRMSSSTTSTTELPKISTDTMRSRFPHRSRRPITTIGHSENEDETTEPLRKFTPKDPRHGSDNSTVDKPFKSVNPRLRPFGRYKSTTETTTSTTPRVSIKPNIFSNLRRPSPISLKARIMNKLRSTTEKAEVADEEETNETEMSEIVESTIPYSVDATTEFGAKKTVDIETTTKSLEEPDILKNEDFMQSQIVSDLTSSAKNEYNKPGMFKNVSPTSRKVPSYFTLATDDPILPIEAFFPNLKDKQ